MKAKLFLLAIALLTPGCSTWPGTGWDSDKWDLSQYRDPRASDIDKRLTERPVTVANPFSK